MEEQFLSPLEVAEILQIKKNTVYEMIKRGDIKATKMGKQFRIARTDVYEYLGMKPSMESPSNIVICGQDLLLDVLCSLFNAKKVGKTQAYRSPMGSYNGLYEMYQNENYVATCHLWDSKTDTYNLTYVERMLPGERLAVFHLLKRWQGLYVKKDNPKSIQGFLDLTRGDVRMVNRDKGSGIRVFIDEMCKKYDISPDQLNGYRDEATSHMIAATMVMRGNADVAVGNEKTSRQVEGIDFIPLKQESYDIVFRVDDLKKKEYQVLLEIIQSEQFQKEAESIEGYDVTGMGERLL
jgi:putative molybdopterin biosynthesis protein